MPKWNRVGRSEIKSYYFWPDCKAMPAYLNYFFSYWGPEGFLVLNWSFWALMPFCSNTGQICMQWCRKVSDRRIWLTKFHSDWQKFNISAAYLIVRTDKIFKISPNDWHVQKDFNISVYANTLGHDISILCFPDTIKTFRVGEGGGGGVTN